MKQLLALVSVLVLAVGAAYARAQNSTDTSAALIIQKERALYESVAKADQAAFESLTLPSGVWAAPSSFFPLGPLASGLSAFDVPGWGIDNPRVVWTDNESALLLYIRTGGGSFDHRPFAPAMLASTLWTKRGGTWVAVYHQESELRQ
jgi:hypothetical protein